MNPQRIKYLTLEEGTELYERQARKYMGMSGDEFAEKYMAGELDGCESNVIRVSMLMPFAGIDPRTGKKAVQSD